MKIAICIAVVLIISSCREKCNTYTKINTLQLLEIIASASDRGFPLPDTAINSSWYHFKVSGTYKIIKTEIVHVPGITLIPTEYATAVYENCPIIKGKTLYANPLESIEISTNKRYSNQLDTIVTDFFISLDSEGVEHKLSTDNVFNRTLKLDQSPMRPDTFDFYFNFKDSNGTVFRDTVFNVLIH